MLFTFHITYPYFLLPNSRNTICAFTQKARKFAKMMVMYGHTVYFYGHEDSEVVCTELISVLTKNDFIEVYGAEPDWHDPGYVDMCVNNRDKSPEIRTKYFAKMVVEMDKIGKKNDIICSFWGFPEELKRFKNTHGMICVEPGIGCPRVFADYCAYESYAIMHNIYGLKNIAPKVYDAVIPNYFDLDEFVLPKDEIEDEDEEEIKENDENPQKIFEISNDKEIEKILNDHENESVLSSCIDDDGYDINMKDYFLFLGRLVNIKGIEIVVEMAKRLPNEKFVFVGPGEISYALTDNVYVYDPVGAIGRTKWMTNAKGFVLPTLYLEPFGGSAVEAMICGRKSVV